MNCCNLKIELSGEGYEQIIKVTMSEKTIIYDGLSDDLVTSINERLELKLNFGQQKCICNYELKKTNNYIILIPRILISESFFKFIPKSIIVFCFEDVVNLWNKLEYDASELNNIPLMNNEDWSLLWLLNMDSDLKTFKIETLADWAIQKTLAEEPDGYPKVTDIVKLISSKKIDFLSDSFCQFKTTSCVVAYIENLENKICEWNAIDFSNRHKLLLGNNWSIEYTNSPLDSFFAHD